MKDDIDRYDDYLDALCLVRRRATTLNISLGNGAPGLLIQHSAEMLHQALEQLRQRWEEDYGKYVPRMPDDPITDEFMSLLMEQITVPDSPAGLT